jgi:hypothetical protein
MHLQSAEEGEYLVKAQHSIALVITIKDFLYIIRILKKLTH